MFVESIKTPENWLVHLFPFQEQMKSGLKLLIDNAINNFIWTGKTEREEQCPKTGVGEHKKPETEIKGGETLFI